MRIAEIFYSIQGEGTLIGVPSVFIRVSGCNLRCSWCDTPYTSWAPEGPEMPISAIVEAAQIYPARHVVVTGGEPMLFQPVVELTRALRSQGIHITIETAGTVYQPVVCDLMSISPKLGNSTPHEREGGKWAQRHEEQRYQPKVLRELMKGYDYQLKFVIADPKDLAEINHILSDIEADRTRVLLMPEGRTADTVRERGQWLAELCKREGFRYAPRLHVDLWGEKRGV